MIRILLSRALQRRQALDLRDTDAARLVDGTGDGLPGIWIDGYGRRWLVQTRDRTGYPDELRGFVSRLCGCGAIYWKRLDQEVKEAPAWIEGERVDEPFLVRENGLSFEIDFAAGYSQGIFLDQRDNRSRVRERIGEGMSLLNCFAYTCAFSVAAAAAGAATVNVDLSGNYLEWGRRNFAHNDLDASAHEFLKGDVFEWLRRLGRKGRRFDGVVLDPPTFSRGIKGKVFQVEKHFDRLVEAALPVVSPGGWLLCTTNCRALPADRFRSLIEDGASAQGAKIALKRLPMPPDFTGEPYLKAFWVRVAG